MEKTRFEDLVSSLQEAKAISGGKAPASRRFEVIALMPRPCVSRSACPKAKFARLMRVSVKTIAKLGQHRAQPHRPGSGATEDHVHIARPGLEVPSRVISAIDWPPGAKRQDVVCLV